MNFNASIASNEKVQFNLDTFLQHLKKNYLHQTNKTLVDRKLNLKKNGLIWNTIHLKDSEHLNDSAVILVSVGLPTIMKKKKAKLCRHNLLSIGFEHLCFFF